MPFSSQVALVQWTESVGLTLVGRDQSSVQLRSPGGHILNFTILQIFPFTYESKRMGIIVRVRGHGPGTAGAQDHLGGTQGSPGRHPGLTWAGLPAHSSHPGHRRAARQGWAANTQGNPAHG